MLHKETVERSTFELLMKIMGDSRLSDFALAGGTNLSLSLGHRKSIDLDLFSLKPFNGEELADYLTKKYNIVLQMVNIKGTVKGIIGEVLVDFIVHSYPLLQNIDTEENIRLYSLKDIAAMKLNAIADNGTRLKDFVDIAYLSSKIPLSEMLNAYSQKYGSEPMRALRGLTYFEDIDFNVEINLTIADFDWKKIKEQILQMVRL
ncbi:hypothetical protein AGMMS49938_16370 [Fibrobacterales bacterium]|nr:hypothetical protein AGMMS49938_16370 [Fibrobacterales bacterium]